MNKSVNNVIITRIKRWGNSLIIRFPRKLLAQLDLAKGSEVEISVLNGQITVVPIKKIAYTLEELLAQCSPENLHGEISFGKPAGNEDG